MGAEAPFLLSGKTVTPDLETTKAIAVASAVFHNIGVETRVNMDEEIRHAAALVKNVHINAACAEHQGRNVNDEVRQGRL